MALHAGGALSDRHGAGRVTLAGTALLVAATLPFTVADAPAAPLTAVLLVARGAGLALVQMPATAVAYSSVSTTEIGDATTLVNIVQRVGGALGAAGVVAVLTRAGGGGDGRAWAFAALSALSALILLPALLLRRAERVREAG
ncbi:MFS transporter [Nocardiopsis sp. NPDC101807]|uniref:MFS transporter n=1 Tax=Nocardiopsis sp. NPDC101807 TaxID=3364339 RepID=UPI0037F4C83E